MPAYAICRCTLADSPNQYGAIPQSQGSHLLRLNVQNVPPAFRRWLSRVEQPRAKLCPVQSAEVKLIEMNTFCNYAHIGNTVGTAAEQRSCGLLAGASECRSKEINVESVVEVFFLFFFNWEKKNHTLKVRILFCWIVILLYFLCLSLAHNCITKPTLFVRSHIISVFLIFDLNMLNYHRNFNLYNISQKSIFSSWKVYCDAIYYTKCERQVRESAWKSARHPLSVNIDLKNSISVFYVVKRLPRWWCTASIHLYI